MPKFFKVFRILLIFVFVIALAIPLTSVIAHADVGDTLYIDIDMESSFEYDTHVPLPTSIKYYSDPAHTTEVTSTVEGDAVVEYFEASDLVNPIAAPKNAGSYIIKVSYHDSSGLNLYDDTEETHAYEITKATITINATAVTRAYNSGTVADSELEYTFDMSCQDILTAEFPLAEDNDEIKLELLTGVLEREAGQDVGVYNILIGSLALQEPNHSNNFDITFNSNTYTITQAPLTIVGVSIDNKVYDATAEGVILTSGTDYVAGRFINDDVEDVYLDLSSAIATFVSSNVGNGIDVILTDYQLLGNKAHNYYVVVPDPYSANITQRVINIAAVEINRVYDPLHTDATLDYNIDLAALAVLETEFSTSDILAIKSNFDGALIRTGTNNVGNYSINQGTLAIPNPGIGGFNTTNYIISYTSASYDINPYDIDVNIDPDQSKIYGEVNPPYTYSISELTPLYAGHTLTGSLSRVAGNNVGTYDITIGTLTVSGTDASNYNIILNDYEDAFSINSRDITITAEDKTSVYGNPIIELTHLITEGSLATGDNITGSLAKDAGLTAGVYNITQGTLSIDNISNYNLTFINGLYTITQVQLTISVDPSATLSKSYGDVDPQMDFILSDGILLAGHSLTGTLGRVAGELAGYYSLNTSGINVLDSSEDNVTDNYAFTLDDSISGGGTYRFQIYKDEIYIDVNMPLSSPFKGTSYEAAPMFYDDAALTVIVLISQADYEIYYYNRGSSTPLLSTPYTPGLYTVKVEFYGTLNYLPKVEPIDYEITRAILTISGISIQNKTYNTTPAATILGMPVLNGSIYDASKITLITTGAVATFADRNVSLAGGVVINKNVTVTGYTLTGDHADYYQISLPITLTAKINPVNLDIAAQEVTREYNPLVPEGVLNYNINSALSLLAIEFGSSNLSVIKSNFTGALHRTPGSSVGVYAINLGTLALPVAIADNYNIRYTSANYRITPINFTVTVTPGQTKVYGEADPAVILFTYDSSKLLTSDVLVGSLVRVTGQNVGNYNITLGSLTVKNMNGEGVDVGDSGLGNYKVTLVSSPFIITKREITFKADNKTIKFGDTPENLTYILQYGNLVYSDAITGSITRTSGNNAGTYAITRGTLSVTNASNYNIIFTNGNYVIEPKNIMLSVDPEAAITKTYGTEDPEIAFILNNATPLITGHTIGGSLGRAPGENADYYPLNTSRVVVYDANDANVTANYAFILDTSNILLRNFTINKRVLNVTAKNITVEKGKGYLLKIEFNGFINGETKDDLDVTFSASVPSTLVEGINPITVTVSPKGSSSITQDKNYSLVIQPGKLTYVLAENIPVVTSYGVESEEFKDNKNHFKGFTYYKGVDIYDITSKSGEQPSREVTVNIDLPEKLLNAKKVGVLFISAEGVSVIPCTIVEGQAEFNITETGMYLIAKPITGFLVIVVPVIGLIGLGVGVFMFLNYYKKKKIKKFRPSKQSLKAKKLGAGAKEENGLKKDFSDSGFDALIDTGEGIAEGSNYDDYDKDNTEVKISKRESKRKAKLDKQSSEIIIMDDVDSAMERPVTMDELIEKPKKSDEIIPKSIPKDDLLEEDFLKSLDKKSTKKEYVIEEKVIEEPVEEIIIPKKAYKKNEDLDDIMEELLKSEPKPKREAVSSGIFGNIQNEFDDIVASDKATPSNDKIEMPTDEELGFEDDDDDDLVAPVHKKSKGKSAPDMSTFGTMDSVNTNELSPMIEKKTVNDKVSLNKVVPNANAPKKPVETKVKVKDEFGNLNDIVDKDLNKEYGESSNKSNDSGKIIKQGGARRFEDD